jgi:hypothetical protein
MIGRYSDMKAANRVLARDVLEVYNDTIRRSLLAVGGYECQVWSLGRRWTFGTVGISFHNQL